MNIWILKKEIPRKFAWNWQRKISPDISSIYVWFQYFVLLKSSAPQNSFLPRKFATKTSKFVLYENSLCFLKTAADISVILLHSQNLPKLYPKCRSFFSHLQYKLCVSRPPQHRNVERTEIYVLQVKYFIATKRKWA